MLLNSCNDLLVLRNMGEEQARGRHSQVGDQITTRISNGNFGPLEFGPQVPTSRQQQIEMAITLHSGGCLRLMSIRWKDLEVHFQMDLTSSSDSTGAVQNRPNNVRTFRLNTTSASGPWA